MTRHLCLFVRNLSLISLVALAAAAGAVTSNPIDPSLPLHLRAGAECRSDNVTDLLTSFGSTYAACAGTVTVEDPNSPLVVVTSDSNAQSSLNAGTLRLKTVSRSYSDGTLYMGAAAYAEAALYDTLTVNGTWVGVRMVELKFQVDGSVMSTAPQPNWQNTRIDGALQIFRGSDVAASFAGLEIAVPPSGIPRIAVQTEGQANMTVTSNAFNGAFDPAQIRFTFSYLFPATTTDRTFTFYSQLRLRPAVAVDTGLLGTTESIIDFGNTGRFSLVAPSDVTVSSASGQFLTPVPEPAASWLWAVGLGFVVSQWRRLRG